MTASDSPLQRFYPASFRADQNGKIADYEATILLPFVDINALLDAAMPIISTLSATAQGSTMTYMYSKGAAVANEAPHACYEKVSPVSVNVRPCFVSSGGKRFGGLPRNAKVRFYFKLFLLMMCRWSGRGAIGFPQYDM